MNGFFIILKKYNKAYILLIVKKVHDYRLYEDIMRASVGTVR